LKVINVSCGSAFDASGRFVLLNGIDSGTDINQRDARKIKLDHLVWQYRVTPNINLDGYGFYQCWIIYDMAPNGVLPAFTDIFTAASSQCAPRVDQMWRFKILKHFTHGVLRSTTVELSENSNVYKYVEVNLGNKLVQYNNTGSGIADIAKGALYMIQIGSNDDSDYFGNHSVRFRDV